MFVVPVTKSHAVVETLVEHAERTDIGTCGCLASQHLGRQLSGKTAASGNMTGGYCRDSAQAQTGCVRLTAILHRAHATVDAALWRVVDKTNNGFAILEEVFDQVGFIFFIVDPAALYPDAFDCLEVSFRVVVSEHVVSRL